MAEFNSCAHLLDNIDEATKKYNEIKLSGGSPLNEMLKMQIKGIQKGQQIYIAHIQFTKAKAQIQFTNAKKQSQKDISKMK